MAGFTRVIPLAQYAGVLRRLQLRVPEIVTRGLRAAGHRAVATLQQRTSDHGAVDTGAFRRGWVSAAEGNTLRISNSSAHGGAVIRGRRAGSAMPPPQALVAWVRRKLKVAKSDARAVAWAVARSIGRRGIRGKPQILEEGHLHQIVDEELRRAFAAAANEH